MNNENKLDKSDELNRANQNRTEVSTNDIDEIMNRV